MYAALPLVEPDGYDGALMNPLLKVFLDICLLRKGPQDVPASMFLLGLVVAAHWALGVVFSLFTLPPLHAALSGLIGTLLLLGMVQGLLALHRKPARLLQTATALAGVEILLGLIALPFSAWVFWWESDRLVPSLISLTIIVWSVVVASHILRHALGVTQAVAVLFALSYTLLSYTVVGLVVPAA